MESIIYMVTNNINGKRYIGVTRYPKNRWKDHIRKAEKNPGTYFHHALAKYGAENFCVEHIATCIKPEYGSEVEREIIKDRKPEYNQTNGGEHTVGKRVPRDVVERIKAANIGKKRTPETRAKQSELKKQYIQQNPEYREKLASHLSKARALVDREKQKDAARQTCRRRNTPEYRKKMSSLAKQREYQKRLIQPEIVMKMAESKKKMILCVNTGEIFKGCAKAAEKLMISKHSLYKNLAGTRDHACGFLFKYI